MLSFYPFKFSIFEGSEMSHGGRRPGSGRKSSGVSRLDAAARQQAMESGTTPLEYMLNVMRHPDSTDEQRMEAAKGAAPYVHARLAHIEQKSDVAISFVARLPSPAPSVEAWLEDRQRRLASTH